MKNSQNKGYVAAGVTAFCVLAGAISLYFFFVHFDVFWEFLGGVAHILRPVFMGMVIAFLLLPIHRHILRFLLSLLSERLRNSRYFVRLLDLIAILLSLVFAAILVYLFLAMVIPQVYFSLIGLIQACPGYIVSIQSWLLTFLEDNPDIQTAIIPVYVSVANSFQEWLSSDILPHLESVSTAFSWLKESIIPNLTGVVSNVSAIVLSFLALLKDLFIALIVSVYLLIRKDTFAAQSKKIVYSIFSTKWGDLIVEEVRSAYRIMSGFINGKLLDSLIIGLITLLCCNLFDFPYPELVATIIGVTNIIPFFGPFIGAVPASLLILLVSPIKCVYFVIFIIILQQFDGNILGPKILGESTGLASFWVLFSILLFGGLFGFAGMVLGVPVFAMIYSVIRRLVYRGLRKHNLPTHTDYYIGSTGPLS